MRLEFMLVDISDDKRGIHERNWVDLLFTNHEGFSVGQTRPSRNSLSIASLPMLGLSNESILPRRAAIFIIKYLALSTNVMTLIVDIA